MYVRTSVFSNTGGYFICMEETWRYINTCTYIHTHTRTACVNIIITKIWGEMVGNCVLMMMLTMPLIMGPQGPLFLYLFQIVIIAIILGFGEVTYIHTYCIGRHLLFIVAATTTTLSVCVVKSSESWIDR